MVEQARLEGKELKLQLVNDGLLIMPEKEARNGWKEAIDSVMVAQGPEVLNSEWLDIPLVSDDELEW